MKLTKITIKNFRRFKAETSLTLATNNLTALVGKNDAGKSTFLDALEIFFSSNPHELITE